MQQGDTVMISADGSKTILASGSAVTFGDAVISVPAN